MTRVGGRINGWKLIGPATRPRKNGNLGRLFRQPKSANILDLVLERPPRPPEVLRGSRPSLGAKHVQCEQAPVCGHHARDLLRAQRLLGDHLRQHAPVGTRQVPASHRRTSNRTHGLDEAY